MSTRTHSNLDRCGDHSAACQGTVISALRIAAAARTGRIEIRTAAPHRRAVDGNRRWARDAGFADVSYGHRMGALKIAEMLTWCDQAGIEMATVYLLSTENLRRDQGELAVLLEIITDVVEEISAPSNNWSVQRSGPGSDRRGLRVDSRGIGLHRRAPTRALPCQCRGRIRRPSGDRRRRAGTADQTIADGASGEELTDAVTVDGIAAHLYTAASPTPTWSSEPRGSNGCPGSCCGKARTRRSGSPRRIGRRSAESISCARCVITPRHRRSATGT